MAQRIPLNREKISEVTPTLGTDDNYVTDAEKANLHAPGSDNQTLPVNSDFTLSGLGEKSYNNLTDKPTIPDELADLTEDTTHRVVTDTEKSTWNAKQAALGFTPEDVSNKQTDLTASATKYPTVNAVNTGLAGVQKFAVVRGVSASDWSISPTVNTIYLVTEDTDPISILPSGGVDGIMIIFKIIVFSASISIDNSIEGDVYTFTGAGECLTLIYDESETLYRIVNNYIP